MRTCSSNILFSKFHEKFPGFLQSSSSTSQFSSFSSSFPIRLPPPSLEKNIFVQMNLEKEEKKFFPDFFLPLLKTRLSLHLSLHRKILIWKRDVQYQNIFHFTETLGLGVKRQFSGPECPHPKKVLKTARLHCTSYEPKPTHFYCFFPLRVKKPFPPLWKEKL